MSGEKLKGIPYSGTLPAVLTGTKAGYLHRYKIYGNMEQTGTPTPENPIVPSECGERTENLFNISMVEQGGWDAAAGTPPTKLPPTSSSYYYRCRYSRIVPLLATTLSLYCSSNIKINYVWIDANGLSLGGSGFQKNGDTATAPEQAVSMTFILGLDGDVNCTPSDFYDINIVSGSTAPTSYIPYGYKLPLLSGSTPVDIYLGESQTTRQIKKLVLTGNETISSMSDANDGAKAVSYTYSALGMTDIINNGRAMNAIPYPIYLSSHFKEKTSGYSTWFNINAGEIGANSVGSTTGNRYLIFGTSEQTQNDFKAYLAQQYANGTPVTIWYILATPTTGTLNEPLRKIGDYVDTIDSTQTTTQIPTTANSTTINWAGEGLAPSLFESIQEWVDIPTYTYTNGEWVADNSN